MFYGLNKIIKNILPKSLFYRALLIVAIPVLVLQLVVTVVADASAREDQHLPDEVRAQGW